MDRKDIVYDCHRGCQKNIGADGQINCTYNQRCCKRGVFDWLQGIPDEDMDNL